MKAGRWMIISLFLLGCIQGDPAATTSSIQETGTPLPTEEVTVQATSTMQTTPAVSATPEITPTIKETPSPEPARDPDAEYYYWIQEEYADVDLPSCEGKAFTHPPSGWNDFVKLIPLGNLFPPEHTIPTHHMYIRLEYAKQVDFQAIGDIRILEIVRYRYPEQNDEDYMFTFALCDQVYGYFIHIRQLSDKVMKAFDEGACEEDSYGDGKYQTCTRKVDVEVKGGEYLGRVGKKDTGGYDLGVYDLRKPLKWANPARNQGRAMLLVCPLDYYADGVRKQMYEKIEREEEPRCGKVNQDVNGTLKGNWYHESANPEGHGEWNTELAFAEDNNEPTTYAVSIGGIFTDAGRVDFKPKHSGTINRAFEEVKPDGKAYCYEGEGKNGSVIIEMESETTLKIEKKMGSCGSSPSFNAPYTYHR